MKIKRSMVVLFVIVATLISLPGVAFAAPTLPDTVDAAEQLSFSPLIYLTAFLAVVMLASVVLSIVFYSKQRTQKALICNNFTCPSNPKAREQGAGAFDYSQIETPSELSGNYTSQSDFVMEEAIGRLAAKPPHVAKHQKFSADVTAPMPLIKLVPEKRHARRNNSVATGSRIAPALSAQSLPTPAIPTQYIPAVSSARYSSAPAAPARYASSSTAAPAQAIPTPVSDVPKELEYLLRKIS